MLCKKPFMIGMLPCACQRCLPCLINRRRVWTHRMMLEGYKHAESSFVTLTYDANHIPADGSLDPGHLRGWWKRLRRALSPARIRYYAVGEYGDETWRPHYHAAVFGLGEFVGGGEDGRGGIVAETWGMGHTFVGGFSRESAQYVAGYVTKKLTRRDDERLRGRYPEFARMSLRPGIGAAAVGDIARVLETDVGLDSMGDVGDVPRALCHSGKFYPLGRYLHGKLRSAVGFSGEAFERARDVRTGEALRELYREAEVTAGLQKASSTAKFVVDRNRQKCLNLEARFRIKSSRRTL